MLEILLKPVKPTVIFISAQEAMWGNWESWLSCSSTCGDGTRTRIRPCMVLDQPSGLCLGQSQEIETCNEGSCPIWSNWSSWGECSAYCDGGTQSRTRNCNAEGECSGSTTDEQQCNQQSCAEPRSMIYWNNLISYPASGRWNLVDPYYLSGKGTTFEQCADYCLNKDGCYAIHVIHRSPDKYCIISLSEFNRGPQCWGSTCSDAEDLRVTNQFGVFRDYYKANPQFLPSNEPDGIINVNFDDVKGVCDETSTAFGTVNYRNMEGKAFLTADAKNVVRELGSNCAVRCFERAGCSAFYTTDDSCTFIIGYAYGVKTNSEVSEAGKIHTACPNNAFKNTYTLVSRWSCIFFAPPETGSIADDIVEQNTGNSDTPLRTWLYETKSNSPMITSSQYVSVEVLDTSGNDARYRPVIFTIETHVRTGNGGSSRRRRRSDDSDLIPVEMLTMENIQKAAKNFANKAAREAKKAAKQLPIMSRTEDILAEIKTIEQQATSFILNGGMELPVNIEVAATGPIETVSFVQTAADGSVAADCSSGTCKCSAGFIDNGNGCEQITDEQPATTLAPTTLIAATTTTKVPVHQPAEYITSQLGKLESVFEENRPGKPRTHLMAKWKKLESKSIQRYNKMKSLGCQFPDSFQNEDVDFDSINVCFVSFFITRAYHWRLISSITNYFRISTELKKLSSTGVMRLHQIAIKFTNIKSFDGTEEMKKR